MIAVPSFRTGTFQVVRAKCVARYPRPQRTTCGKLPVMLIFGLQRPAMTSVNLRLFGGFEAVSSSGTSLALPTKKAKALLAYCALRPGQPHQRDMLATLFWGETDDARARNSLRQTLFILRAALGEEWAATLRIE